MVSAFSNPGQPPLMSAESQSPGLFALGKANFKENMKDPRKSAILQSMLMQSLGQIGGGAMGGGQMGGGPRMQPRPSFNPMDMAMMMQRPQAPSMPAPTAAQPMPQSPMPQPMPPKDPAQSPFARYGSKEPKYYQAI